MVHKRRFNQTKSRPTDEENDTPGDVEPMEVLFDIFYVSIPWEAPAAKMQRRQSKKKIKDTERIDINTKIKRYCLRAE